MDVSWYERLHKWEDARQAYLYKIRLTEPFSAEEQEDPKNQKENIENKLGYMRCLEALGQWLVEVMFSIGSNDS